MWVAFLSFFCFSLLLCHVMLIASRFLTICVFHFLFFSILFYLQRRVMAERQQQQMQQQYQQQCHVSADYDHCADMEYAAAGFPTTTASTDNGGGNRRTTVPFPLPRYSSAPPRFAMSSIPSNPGVHSGSRQQHTLRDNSSPPQWITQCMANYVPASSPSSSARSSSLVVRNIAAESRDASEHMKHGRAGNRRGENSNNVTVLVFSGSQQEMASHLPRFLRAPLPSSDKNLQISEEEGSGQEEEGSGREEAGSGQEGE